jgi:phosphoribosylamine--glycine ligase
MHILVIDIDGCGLDFCLRCLAAGHEVRLFIRNDPKDGRSLVGQGMVEKVPHWEPHLNWADLILLTGNDYYVHNLEPLRKHYPIFGPPLEGMRLELDREFGSQILKEHGVNMIPYTTFRSHEAAEEWVRKNPRRFVSKPTDNRKANANKALSYVSKDAADMVYMLQRWRRLGKNKGPFMLQEFRAGVEIGVSCWFAGGRWGKINENFEFKKLMPGDVGVNTGEMGSVLKYVDRSRLFNQVLRPLGGYLADIDYRGDIDLNCIVDEDGEIWPLEFTSRLGWPAFYIMQAQHLCDPAQWMLDLMNGRDTLEVSDEVAVGVLLAQPDFPYSRFTRREVAGVPIYGITDENWDRIHLSEVMRGRAPVLEDGKVVEQEVLVACGDYVLIATGLGGTVRQAQRRAYAVVDQIKMPNSIMYRNDIGDRLKDQLPELHKHNLAMEFEY